jgi:alpha-glucosidase (family GH31 glycosyl hydrolase)
MTSPIPNILHIPYGEDHPYEQSPYERFPRDPLANEPVTLGVQTKPAKTMEEIWAYWKNRRTNKEAVSFGSRIRTEQGTDIWSIPIQSFAEGDRIEYWIHGKSGSQEFRTNSFFFSIPYKVFVEKVIILEKKDNRFCALLSTDRLDIFLRLDVVLTRGDTVLFHLRQVKTSVKINTKTISSGEIDLGFSAVKITLNSSPFHICIHQEKHGVKLESEIPLSFLLDPDTQGFLSCSLGFSSPADEAFYGFGQRFNALDQRGNCLDSRVYDQPKNQGRRTYFPVPFFLSSQGYGVWVRTNRNVKFDLAATKNNCWKVECEIDRFNPEIDFYFFLGKEPLNNLDAFTRLSGRPEMPPPGWAFGLWLSSNNWDQQKDIEAQVALAERYSIPITVMVIEAWSDEETFYIWNDAGYKHIHPSKPYRLSNFVFPSTGRWPDPKAMVDILHQAGIRLVLWQIPVIRKMDSEKEEIQSQNKADEVYAIKKGYCIKLSNGEPYRVQPPWFRGSLLIDFTNPQATKWWINKRAYLLREMGVDGFKTDGGEHLWMRETKFFDGSWGNERINTFPLLYQDAYYRFLRKIRGNDMVLFSRSGYTGAQSCPSHWMGDENSTWEAFRASFCAMLNLGISGVPFVGWDMAGFGGELPSAELYLRAVAASVFCPIMQLHAEHNEPKIPCMDRTPWNIQERKGDPDIIRIFTQFANLRMNLIPYILSEAWSARQTGIPIMRALPLEYPHNLNNKHYPLEYFFGKALLVAPVVEPGMEVWGVSLPSGEWRDLWSGNVLSGSQLIRVPVPKDRIPVYQRKGTILPLNLGNDLELCSPVGNDTEHYQNLFLLVFADSDCEVEIHTKNWRQARKVKCSYHTKQGWIQVDLPTIEDALHILFTEVQALEIHCDGIPFTQTKKEKPLLPGEWSMDPEKRITQIYLPAINAPRKVMIRKE